MAKDSRVFADDIIHMTSKKSEQLCDEYLRRVVWYDAELQETFEFVTNHMKLSPVTIEAIYKDRWQIAIFFKFLKQNQKI